MQSGGIGSRHWLHLRPMNSAAQPLVYAVVLNWNGADETVNCLHSLNVQTHENFKILVVDNGSSDDSITTMRAAHPTVEILELPENVGFARGMNAGIRHAIANGAEWILGLNNDLELAPDCTEQLLAYATPDVGLITAVLYFRDERTRIWSIGGNISKYNLEKTSDARGVLDEGQLPPVLDRQFIPGGATLMSVKAFNDVGLFDEMYFLYYEDADLSLRMSRSGYRSLCATRAKMWHGIAKSSGGSGSPRERYWMGRSSVIYFAKNAAWWQVPIVLFWRSASAIRTTGRLLRQRKIESLRSYWRGLRDGMRDVRQSTA